MNWLRKRLRILERRVEMVTVSQGVAMWKIAWAELAKIKAHSDRSESPRNPPVGKVRSTAEIRPKKFKV